MYLFFSIYIVPMLVSRNLSHHLFFFRMSLRGFVSSWLPGCFFKRRTRFLGWKLEVFECRRFRHLCTSGLLSGRGNLVLRAFREKQLIELRISAGHKGRIFLNKRGLSSIVVGFLFFLTVFRFRIFLCFIIPWLFLIASSKRADLKLKKL